jgi:exodeoxyribonuclease VII large subunit
MQAMHERAKAVWSRLQSIRTREHAMRAQRLLHARARLLAKHPAALPELLAIRSTTAMRRLADASNSAVRLRVQKLQGLGRTLHAISPLATVDRGYALVQDTRGALIQSVDQVSLGDELVARVRDGRLSVKVTAKEKDA